MLKLQIPTQPNQNRLYGFAIFYLHNNNTQPNIANNNNHDHEKSTTTTFSFSSASKSKKVVFAILSWMATGNKPCLIRADGELIASWVQFTGADMQRPECASRLENPTSTPSSSQHQGPDCFFTAEVRAIYNYNDTAMLENPECPSDALKIDGKEMTMSIRVNAVEHFENFVCYALLPQNVNSIELEGHKLPIPKWDIGNGKVAVIGDTGCRQGPSHAGLYQSCLNPSLWPFKRVSESVYESKPDLVVHWETISIVRVHAQRTKMNLVKRMKSLDAKMPHFTQPMLNT